MTFSHSLGQKPTSDLHVTLPHTYTDRDMHSACGNSACFFSAATEGVFIVTTVPFAKQLIFFCISALECQAAPSHLTKKERCESAT